VNQPSGNLLTLMTSCIGATLGGAALRPLGTPGVVLGSLMGGLVGWILAKRLLRRLF
jgi:hypothetical protein